MGSEVGHRHRRGSCSISYNLWATLQIKREHKQSAFLGSVRDDCEREGENCISVHLSLPSCSAPSCCVCWHFMWFGQQLQRDKTKQLPCSVLFARLLLRLLISVNREGSFVCPVVLSLCSCQFTGNLFAALCVLLTQLAKCVSVARTQKKRC